MHVKTKLSNHKKREQEAALRNEKKKAEQAHS